MHALDKPIVEKLRRAEFKIRILKILCLKIAKREKILFSSREIFCFDGL